MSDERALLDECTNRPTCTAAMHLSDCPSSSQLRLLGALQRSVDSARATREKCAGPVLADQLQPPEPERQTWERRVGGTDIAENRIHLQVDDQGRAYIHEAVLAQLLVDAGWERTA